MILHAGLSSSVRMLGIIHNLTKTEIFADFGRPFIVQSLKNCIRVFKMNQMTRSTSTIDFQKLVAKLTPLMRMQVRCTCQERNLACTLTQLTGLGITNQMHQHHLFTLSPLRVTIIRPLCTILRTSCSASHHATIVPSAPVSSRRAADSRRRATYDAAERVTLLNVTTSQRSPVL